jgi:RNA polymerase sigma-70 factor, ECF subfamily
MATMTATIPAAASIEALYRQDGGRLWRALLAFAGDPEVASDAVAETFAQALRRGNAVRDPQAWVWRTGFRIAAGEMKRRVPTTSLVPDTAYLDPQVDFELLEALRRLPARQRVAVILFYYVDAPVVEIARRTGMSPLAVRANLSRGRKRLKSLLGDAR